MRCKRPVGPTPSEEEKAQQAIWASEADLQEDPREWVAWETDGSWCAESPIDLPDGVFVGAHSSVKNPVVRKLNEELWGLLAGKPALNPRTPTPEAPQAVRMDFQQLLGDPKEARVWILPAGVATLLGQPDLILVTPQAFAKQMPFDIPAVMESEAEGEGEAEAMSQYPT